VVAFLKRHRRGAIAALGAILAAGFVYFVVPQIAAWGRPSGACARATRGG
jgi:hypothetical protein